MVKRKDLIEKIKPHLQDYADMFLTKSKSKNMYVCPLCGSGTGPHATGAFSINPKDDSWHCFTCGKGGDVLDLIREKENIILVPKQIERACQLFKIPYNEETSYKDIPKKINYKDFFLEANKHLSDTDYLEKRGISLETANKFNLGFIQEWKHPNAEKYSYIEGTPRLIIPTGKESYLARDIRINADKTYQKMKVGEQGIFNLKAIEENEPIFIVEGELDAISLYEVGAKAIGLGSVSRVRNLIEYLKQEKPKKQLLIALDNDEEGKKATKKLSEELDKLKIEYVIVDIVGDAKDPNEALVKNRQDFSLKVNEALSIESEAEKLEKEAYLNTSVKANLGKFLDDIKESKTATYIQTGFDYLDAVLDGGLYAGLYTVGAISSLGKTTLITQIADNIAKAGNDVIIFSLEMARNELIAKSISRLTLQIALNNAIPREYAKTSRGITVTKRYANYNQKEKDLIAEAFKEYEKKYSENVYINEGIGDIGVEEIRETVNKHISFTGKKPIIVIDYLQILAPYNERGTDKQNTDKAVMELRRIARDFKIPVIAVSSLNRTSYNEAITMEAFKESGAIEYSSDVLIGLQLKGAGRKDFNPQEEKKKDPRDVELIILKNRNGKVGEIVNLEYYPMFNYFRETK